MLGQFPVFRGWTSTKQGERTHLCESYESETSNPSITNLTLNRATALCIYRVVNCYQTYYYEPCHEISNNVVCVASKGSDQPAQIDQSLC